MLQFVTKVTVSKQAIVLKVSSEAVELEAKIPLKSLVFKEGYLADCIKKVVETICDIEEDV